MRLLNVKTLAFEESMDERAIPSYAILSHTWDAEEVTYQDMCDGISEAVQQKAGLTKIKLACEQANADGLRLCWVDTCCIDKKSSAELSEAINSMFRWYARSKVCYAYLKDVEVVAGSATNLRQSRWFTRGSVNYGANPKAPGTIQELIAPSAIEFYGSAWKHFGTDVLLAESLSKITGIDIDVLCRKRFLEDVCVARRMSWASGRQTTRIEDIAYCLLGIFEVNMPLLYGEGHKAFYRLQEQIIRESGDDSILAWDYIRSYNGGRDYNNLLLAPSPDFFRHCRNVRHCTSIAWNDRVDLTNHGLRFKSHYFSSSMLMDTGDGGHYPVPKEAVMLNCYREDDPGLRLALRLQKYADSSSVERGYSICPQWSMSQIPKAHCEEAPEVGVQGLFMSVRVVSMQQCKRRPA